VLVHSALAVVPGARLNAAAMSAYTSPRGATPHLCGVVDAYKPKRGAVALGHEIASSANASSAKRRPPVANPRAKPRQVLLDELRAQRVRAIGDAFRYPKRLRRLASARSTTQAFRINFPTEIAHARAWATYASKQLCGLLRSKRTSVTRVVVDCPGNPAAIKNRRLK